MAKAITKINGYYLKDVDVRNKLPKSTRVEDGKIYLLDSSGNKLDTGTSLPTSSSGGGSTTDLTEVNNKISTLETSTITNSNKIAQLETKSNNADSKINSLTTALNGTSIRVLTKSQYNSLTTKDSNTLYFVKKES